jgi:predicted RNase H-like HicB family nuclease
MKTSASRKLRKAPGSKPKAMRLNLTATIQKSDGWYVAFCPEVPEGNGQGKTKGAALRSLWQSIELLIEDRRADAKSASSKIELVPLVVA